MTQSVLVSIWSCHCKQSKDVCCGCFHHHFNHNNCFWCFVVGKSVVHVYSPMPAIVSLGCGGVNCTHQYVNSGWAFLWVAILLAVSLWAAQEFSTYYTLYQYAAVEHCRRFESLRLLEALDVCDVWFSCVLLLLSSHLYLWGSPSVVWFVWMWLFLTLHVLYHTTPHNLLSWTARSV